MRRFVAVDDRVVAQRPLHKPADVLHASSQVRALKTSKTATAELGRLRDFKLGL
jgi:hypothetical protein